MTKVVTVGAGPVGQWTSSQLKKRMQDKEDGEDFSIDMLERKEIYARSHVLRVNDMSMLLYARHSFNPLKDPHGDAFFRSVTGKSLKGIYMRAATGTTVLRTNDLEHDLTTLTGGLGIQKIIRKVEDPYALFEEYPDTDTFIAADGTKSIMRETLMPNSITHEHLQYVVELKYETEAGTQPLGLIGDYKSKKLLTNIMFEYVGREKDGKVPVTLRLFIDQDLYDSLPDINAGNPMRLDDPRLPQDIRDDFQTYMNVRRIKAGEQFTASSGKLTKLTLMNYSAKRFATIVDGRAVFLVGDSSCGVPYYRSLNAGMIIGSQLAGILAQDWSNETKVAVYNAVRVPDLAWEFTTAHAKNRVLTVIDTFRKASANVPWEVVKWSKDDIRRFRTEPHPAFPADPQPSLILV